MLKHDGERGIRFVGSALSPSGCLRAGGSECELGGNECELAGSAGGTECEPTTRVVCEPTYG